MRKDVFLGDKKAIPDDEIARCAMDIVGWDTLLPSGAIQIIVRDGWVTLTGNVEWYYQLKAAEEDVRKLPGVRGVTNSIAITPRVEAQDVKQKIEDALKRHAELRAKGIRSRFRMGTRCSSRVRSRIGTNGLLWRMPLGRSLALKGSKTAWQWHKRNRHSACTEACRPHAIELRCIHPWNRARHDRRAGALSAAMVAAFPLQAKAARAIVWRWS